MKTVLMSIKPKYSRRIFLREKRYELRRTPIKLQAGDVVLVYESTPMKALVGAFVVEGVRRGDKTELWNELGEDFGVSGDEYRDYFEGTQVAHAIEVGDVVEIEPIPLGELRDRHRGFRPPQSYMYWRQPLKALLGVAAALAVCGVVAKLATASDGAAAHDAAK